MKETKIHASKQIGSSLEGGEFKNESAHSEVQHGEKRERPSEEGSSTNGRKYRDEFFPEGTSSSKNGTQQRGSHPEGGRPYKPAHNDEHNRADGSGYNAGRTVVIKPGALISIYPVP